MSTDIFCFISDPLQDPRPPRHQRRRRRAPGRPRKPRQPCAPPQHPQVPDIPEIHGLPDELEEVVYHILRDMEPRIVQDMEPIIAQDEMMQMDFTAPVQGNPQIFMELTNTVGQPPIEEENFTPIEEENFK